MINNENLGSSIAAIGGFLILLLLPFDALLNPISGLSSFQQQHIGDAIKNLVIIGFGLVLIHRFGYWSASGLKSLRVSNGWLMLVPLYFLLLGPIEYYLLDYPVSSILRSDVFLLLFANLTVGFSEEIIFRGFVLPHLLKGSAPGQKIIGPVSLAALLFGMLHFLNLLSPDAAVVLTFAQVIYATMFGIAFGILLLRTGSIYPIGMLHGLINFSSNGYDLPGVEEPGILSQYQVEEALISVLVVMPFFLLMLRQLCYVTLEKG